MKTYEYTLIKMEPVFTDSGSVEEILNQKGGEGYRYVGIQKLWTEDSDGQSIRRNFIVLERKSEEEL